MRGYRTVLAGAAVATAVLAGACGTATDQGSSGNTPSDDPTSTAASTSSASNSATASATESRPTTESGKPTSRPGRVGAKCDNSHLTPSIVRGDSGAGSRHATLVLTNTSQTTCTLYGYGGLQLYASAGRPLPTRVVRDRDAPPTTLIVAPGTKVRSTLTWSAVPHGADPANGPCQPTAKLARVTPPDETSTKQVSWKFGPVCDKGRILQGAYKGTKLGPGR